MPESAYDRERARTCAWCAKGLASNTAGDGRVYHSYRVGGLIHNPYCTAPTLAEFAELKAKRVEELEKAIAELPHDPKCSSWLCQCCHREIRWNPFHWLFRLCRASPCNCIKSKVRINA